MEFDAAVSLWTEKTNKLQGGIDKLYKRLPLHKPFGGSIITPAVAPPILVVPVAQSPASGRIWNVLRIGVFGTDPHTPVGFTNFQVGGNVTDPASAGVNIANLGTLPIGNYQINWQVGLQGTVTAADANNMRVKSSGVNLVTAEYPGVVGNYPQPPFELANVGTGVTAVQSVAAASGASAIYTANISAVPLDSAGNLPPVSADVYLGSAPDQATAQAFTDILASGWTVPTVQTFGRLTQWCRYGEQIYALIYNPPALQQFVITAFVADYPLESVESLGI